MHTPAFTRSGKAAGTIIGSILTFLLLSLGVYLEMGGFQALTRMRQMERVLPTEVDAALPGPVQLSGTVGPLGKTLQAPGSAASCVYYRHVIDRRHDDGWSRFRDNTVTQPFTLRDTSGSIRVVPDQSVPFRSAPRFSAVEGQYRHTQWWIVPGDAITVTGTLEETEAGSEVRFARTGEYVPSISAAARDWDERASQATRSLSLSAAGLVCLSFAVYFACYLLKVHRLLVYLSALVAIQFLVLTWCGLRMMRYDLVAAQERVERQIESANRVIRSTLDKPGVTWSGKWNDAGAFNDPRLGEQAQARLRRIRLDVGSVRLQAELRRRAFPERWLARLWNLPSLPQIELHPVEQREVATSGAGLARPRAFRDSPILATALISVGFIVAPILTWLGLRQIRFKRCIENVPTSEIAGVSYGLTEFVGFTDTLENEEPGRGRLTGLPCVYYHYVVREKTGRGKNQRWTVRENETCHWPFRCSDGTATIEVDPDGAEFLARKHTRRYEGKFRYDESRIELGDRIYAIGHADIHPDTGATLRLCKPDEASLPFILSNYDEAEVMHRKAAKGMLNLNAAFCALAAGALIFSGTLGALAATDFLLCALVGPLFLVLVTFVLHYNDVVFLYQRAARNWANIEVSLRKRYDLLPNIEAVAAGFLAHETAVQQHVAQLRELLTSNVATTPGTVANLAALEAALAQRFLGLRESNPELTASHPMIAVMNALMRLENEIALMRKGYNDAAEAYNTRLQRLPDRLFAWLGGFREMAYIT